MADLYGARHGRDILFGAKDAYNPSEAREPDGEWTEGGGSVLPSNKVFTTAPQRQTIFGNNRAFGESITSNNPVPIYHDLGPSEVARLLKGTYGLRVVLTPKKAYVADAQVAAHAGMRNVLKDYGVDKSDVTNLIITSPKRLTYAWGKYLEDDPQHLRWRAKRQAILDNPAIKRMFPDGVTVVRDDWT